MSEEVIEKIKDIIRKEDGVPEPAHVSDSMEFDECVKSLKFLVDGKEFVENPDGSNAHDDRGNPIVKQATVAEFANRIMSHFEFACLQKEKRLLVKRNRVFVDAGELIGDLVECAFEDATIKFYTELVAKIGRRRPAKREDFDQDPYILNLKNTFYDLRTGKPVELPDYKSLVQFDVEYDPEAGPSQVWLPAVEDIAGDKASLILDWCALGLAPRAHNIEKALVLLGPRDNGKSTILEAYGEIFGSDSYASLDMYQLEDPSALYGMIGKSLNICTEMPDARALKSWAKFKTLVSGESTTIRRLYSPDPITVRLLVPLAFATNSLPHRPRISEAVDKRLIIVECQKQFQKDDSFKDRTKDPAELSRILNTLLSTWQEIQGKPRLEQSIEEIQEIWESSVTDYFVENHLEEVEEGAGDTLKDVHKFYRTIQPKKPHLNFREFNKYLRDEYGFESQPWKGQRRWMNLRLRRYTGGTSQSKIT